MQACQESKKIQLKNLVDKIHKERKLMEIVTLK